MNIKLLKIVAEYIRNNPERYDQDTYCGSACCIAGHAVFLSKDSKYCDMAHQPSSRSYEVIVGSEARSLLQLTSEQWKTTCSFAEEWPEPFKSRYINTLNKTEMATIAYERIMHLIHTGK